MVFAEAVLDRARPWLAGGKLLLDCGAFVGALVDMSCQRRSYLHWGVAHYAERGEDFPVGSGLLERVLEDEEILLPGLGFGEDPAVGGGGGEARR